MAGILNFMPTFIATSKKKLWELSDKDEEQEAAVEPSSGFFGSVFEYVDDAFDWQPPLEQDFSVPEPFYDAPAEDMGIGSAIGDAFGDIQWGQPDPGIGSALGDSFGSEWFTDPVGPEMSTWGQSTGAPEDWWQVNDTWEAPTWDLPVPQLEPQWEPSQFGSALMGAHEGDNAWADVIDMRGEQGPLMGESTSFGPVDVGQGQPRNLIGETGGWQLPDFGSIFSDIAGGYGSALTDIPDEYAFDEANWAPVPTGADPEFYRSQTPEDQAYLANELGMGSDFISGIGGLPQETLAKYSFDEMPTRDLGSTLGGGLKDIWDTVQTASNAGGQTIGDVVFDPIKGATDLNNLGAGALFPMVFEGVNAVVPGSPFPDYDLDTPGADTLANIQAADDPWNFAELQEADFVERPMAEQIALQAYLPGNGVYGNYKSLPRGLSQIERASDILQGGPLLGALGDIPGIGAFASNVVLPGVAGGVAGGAVETIFDPTFNSPYADPLTGERASYDPSLLESIGGGALAGVLGKNAVDLVPGQGIKNVGDDFVLPDGLQKSAPRFKFGSKTFIPEFQDDLDRALFVVRDASKKSASDEKFMAALREYLPGMSDEEIRAGGDVVHSTIKNIVKDLDPQGKPMKVEIPPVARGLGTTEEELPAYLNPWIATTDELTNGQSVVPIGDIPAPKPAWEPIDESIADLNDLAFDAPKPVDPVFNDLLTEVNKQREWRALTDMDGERAAWLKLQSETKAAARKEALAQGATASQAEVAAQAAVEGLSMKNPFPAPVIAAETRDAIIRRMDELNTPEFMRSQNMRVLRNWENGQPPRPKELNDLWQLITGSEAPERAIVAREMIPGTNTSVGKIVAEVADAELDDATKATIGANDVEFLEPNYPSTAADDWLPIGDTDAVATTADDIAQMTDDPYATGGVAQVQNPAPVTAGARGGESRTIRELENKMVNEGAGLKEGDLQKKLDEAYSLLAPSLSPEGKNAAQLSKARVAERIALEREARLRAETSSTVQRWLRENAPVMDEIAMDDTVSVVKRGVGGATKNKLADTMAQRSRDLYSQLRARGFETEEAIAVVNKTQGEYLDDRLIRNLKTTAPTVQRNAMMEHALTSLRMSEWRPEDPRGFVKPDTEVGNVSGFLKNMQGINSKMKNQTFGLADASALFGNALPALVSGWVPLARGYMNILLNQVGHGVDMTDVRDAAALAGLQVARSQDQTAPEEGMLFLKGAGDLLDKAKQGNIVSKGLRAADKPATKWNEFLTKAQFDFLMYRALRQPIYEGNLLLLKTAGQDINDPAVRRAAARMANSVTSAAPQATNSSRRAFEGGFLNTAQFTRAQGDFLIGVSKLLNKNATKSERIVAATTLGSMVASIYTAQQLLGNDLEIDPTDPDFGKVRLPNGKQFDLFGRQQQLAKTLVETGDFLVSSVPGVAREGDGDDVYQAWAKFILGRAGPAPSTAARAVGMGFDPTGDTPGWNFPGMFGLDGKGDQWGRDMSVMERVYKMLPLPTSLDQTIRPALEGKLGATDVALNTAGAGVYDESELDKALREEGLTGVDDIRAYYREEFPDTSESKIRKFFQKYPDARTEDEELATIRKNKAASSEAFETSADKQTVGKWRDRMNELSDQTAGIFMTKDLDGKEPPDEDNAARWIYDFNKTFQDAKDEDGSIDGSMLERLQTDFWSEHKSPAVRKEVIQYQLANATTDAEKTYIEDMARLNGFDPKTGKALTWNGSKNKMPSYFEMERYASTEMKNDETKEFIEGFTNWKQDLTGPLADLEKSKLIDIYIDEKAQTRPSGKAWTPAAVVDAKKYGLKSAWTPEFKAYKDEMEAELMWFDDNQHWDSIEAAHRRSK